MKFYDLRKGTNKFVGLRFSATNLTNLIMKYIETIFLMDILVC